MGFGIGKYVQLLHDTEVRRWYENLRRGSRITADNSLRQLGLLCKRWNTDMQGLLTLHRQDLLQGRLEDEVSRLEREGYAGSYISNILKPVRSWLEFNGLELKRRIKISNYNLNPSVADERVPTREELARILRHLDRRGKAVAALIGFAGLRIEVVGNYDATDGLMMKDLPELKVQGALVEFEKIPTMVRVRATLSKTKLPYFTFLTSEGCTYLKEYLESRLLAGENLSPETPVISHNEKRANTIRRFLWSTKIGAILRGSKTAGKSGPTGIRGAGYGWRPYVLRAYADTALDIAESKGLISHQWRQFFMGHKGDIEARYSTNKGRLPPDMIEEMRTSYKRCEQYLQTEKSGISSEDDIKRTFKEQFLLVAGYRKEEIEKMDLDSVGNEEIQQMVRQRLLGALTNNGNRQRVVPVAQVKDFIGQGWEYVAQLPDGEAIVKLPS